MTHGLPRCTITDLPRVMCGCPLHNDSFTMTAEEKDFLDQGTTELDLPQTPRPAPHHRQVLDYLSRRWRSTPGGSTCDHGKPEGMRLCPDCTERLQAWLADMPHLTAELEITLTKQDTLATFGHPQEADPDEGVLPWKEGASRAIRALWAALGGRPAPTARALLGDWQETLSSPHVEELYGRLAEAVRVAHRQIERAPTRQFYGKCPNCGDDIYQERIPPDDPAGVVECRCGYRARLAAHQAAQLEVAETAHVTVREAVKLLNDGGEPTDVREVENLIYRQEEGVLPRWQENRARWKDGRLVPHLVYVYQFGHIRTGLLAKRIRRRAS